MAPGIKGERDQRGAVCIVRVNACVLGMNVGLQEDKDIE